MTYLKLIFISITFIFLSISCENKPQKCEYGDAKAIFSDTMKMVKKHHFEVKDKTGIEMVKFDNGMMLELEQSGCHEINQQFTFIMPGDFSKANDNIWKLLTVKNFQMLASYSPQLMAFNNWASAIDNAKDKIKLADAYELDKNIFVRIDKIVSPEQSSLVVQLSQIR